MVMVHDDFTVVRDMNVELDRVSPTLEREEEPGQRILYPFPGGPTVTYTLETGRQRVLGHRGV